jgi:hypothetical protein
MVRWVILGLGRVAKINKGILCKKPISLNKNE